MTLKIHFIGLAVIILLLVAITYKSSQPVVVVSDSPYVIQIENASYGLNCNQQKTSSDPYAQSGPKKIEKNNVLSAVSAQCTGKVSCSFAVDPTVLGLDPAPGCGKKLDVDYRCFSYDRPWKASGDDFETMSIDCSKRGD